MRRQGLQVASARACDCMTNAAIQNKRSLGTDQHRVTKLAGQLNTLHRKLLILQAGPGWLFRQAAALIQLLCLSLANSADALFNRQPLLAASLIVKCNYRLQQLACSDYVGAATDLTPVSGQRGHMYGLQNKRTALIQPLQTLINLPATNCKAPQWARICTSAGVKGGTSDIGGSNAEDCHECSTWGFSHHQLTSMVARLPA